MISKRLTVFIAVLVFVLSMFASNKLFSRGQIGGADLISPLVYKPPSGNGASPLLEETKEVKTEECPLNGEYLTKTQKNKWEKRRPLGIMIENHKEARPQSGLSSADVIYEAVAEGGITRTLSVFYCKDSSYIGPVRSARIYFLKLMQGYGDYPLYVHVGGANSPGPADALGEISDLGWANYNDLNQFSVPFPNFWRDYERLPNRATEHTVYSSTSKLWEFAKNKRNLTDVDKKGERWDTSFSRWRFKDDTKSEARGTINKLSFGFWTLFSQEYSVVWSYNKISNSYKRENGGEPHIDKNTGKQLEAKNIVVVFSDESAVRDDYGGHLFYDIVGSGTGLAFQDGNAIKITWKKTKEESQIKFYDPTGKELQLVRGQVWVEILPTGNKVIY